jgi:hypothetical protein
MLPKVVLAMVVCTVMLPSLVRSEESGQALVEVIMLRFDEQESGTDMYPVRMLISDTDMRFDDGRDDGDFVLMNRKSRSLFSVNHEEQTILVVEYRAAGIELPQPPELTVTEQMDDAAPRIMGRKTVSRDYLADGELCLQVVAVPGLLEAAVDAMREYAGVLAERQKNTLESVPDFMRTPCFFARYIHAPAQYLENGLPIQERDATGYRRTLVDFDESRRVSRTVFSLPTGYDRFSLD